MFCLTFWRYFLHSCGAVFWENDKQRTTGLLPQFTDTWCIKYHSYCCWPVCYEWLNLQYGCLFADFCEEWNTQWYQSWKEIPTYILRKLWAQEEVPWMMDMVLFETSTLLPVFVFPFSHIRLFSTSPKCLLIEEVTTQLSLGPKIYIFAYRMTRRLEGNIVTYFGGVLAA